MINDFMIKKILTTGAVSLGLLLPAVSLADVVVVFNSGAATPAGTPITISGTVMNTGTQTVYLTASTTDAALAVVGQVASGTPAGISVDQSATSGYLPASLGAGETYQGSLVKLNVSSAAVPGNYWSIYNIVGNTASTSSSVLASQPYYFSVAIPYMAPATTSMPSFASTTITTTVSTTTASSADSLSNFAGLQMPVGLQFQDPGTGSGSLPMQAYVNGPRLIKLEGSDIVYWVSGNNLKLHMLNRGVFLSYKNKDEDVQVVSREELDYYPAAKYIWLNGKGGIYKVDPDAKTKRLISVQAWAESGLGADQVIKVNRTEFNSYKTGSKITDSADLE